MRATRASSAARRDSSSWRLESSACSATRRRTSPACAASPVTSRSSTEVSGRSVADCRRRTPYTRPACRTVTSRRPAPSRRAAGSGGAASAGAPSGHVAAATSRSSVTSQTWTQRAPTPSASSRAMRAGTSAPSAVTAAANRRSVLYGDGPTARSCSTNRSSRRCAGSKPSATTVVASTDRSKEGDSVLPSTAPPPATTMTKTPQTRPARPTTVTARATSSSGHPVRPRPAWPSPSWRHGAVCSRPRPREGGSTERAGWGQPHTCPRSARRPAHGPQRPAPCRSPSSRRLLGPGRTHRGPPTSRRRP